MTVTVTHQGVCYEAICTRGPRQRHTRVSIYRDGQWDRQARLTPHARIDRAPVRTRLPHAVIAALEAAIQDSLARGLGADIDPSGTPDPPEEEARPRSAYGDTLFRAFSDIAAESVERR